MRVHANGCIQSLRMHNYHVPYCAMPILQTNRICKNLASRQAPNDSHPRMHTLAVASVVAHALDRILPAALKSEQLQPVQQTLMTTLTFTMKFCSIVRKQYANPQADLTWLKPCLVEHRPQTTCLNPALSQQVSGTAGGRRQFCPPSPSYSSCNWNLLCPFLSPDLSSTCSLVTLYFCGPAVSTVVPNDVVIVSCQCVWASSIFFFLAVLVEAPDPLSP